MAQKRPGEPLEKPAAFKPPTMDLRAMEWRRNFGDNIAGMQSTQIRTTMLDITHEQWTYTEYLGLTKFVIAPELCILQPRFAVRFADRAESFRSAYKEISKTSGQKLDMSVKMMSTQEPRANCRPSQERVDGEGGCIFSALLDQLSPDPT